MLDKIKTGKLDISIIVLCPIVATFLCLAFKLNAMMSVVLFFMMPSIYLSFRAKRIALRAFLFSLIAAVPTIIWVDYIAHVTGQWLIPHSILSHRLFGYVTIEVVAWAIFNFYFVIMFYEYFLDRHFAKKLLYPHMKRFIIIVMSLFLIFVMALLLKPDLLIVPYFYLIFGVTLILIPVVIEVLTHPRLTSDIFYSAGFFFYLSFLYEFSALKLDWWRFPSNQFVGWFTFLGAKYPFEEFIFWLMLFAMAIITAYKKFDDIEA